MEKPRLTAPDLCPRCGQEFHCSKSARCWCFEVQTTPQVLEYVQERWAGCLCPACLEAVVHALGQTDVRSGSSSANSPEKQD
ncbi:MAG: cysteine-rich CWC family protein [Bacteroidetes bacterium]|nr:cysteine-rich CWC family protein [Bacteroidota bacterium]